MESAACISLETVMLVMRLDDLKAKGCCNTLTHDLKGSSYGMCRMSTSSMIRIQVWITSLKIAADDERMIHLNPFIHEETTSRSRIFAVGTIHIFSCL
ncbi:unnamed protein product [Angiostrongylus costaricensis]|uniref:Secreted protein n=1 Tax=Angiostrongylus costaricensis TaxID=334426 RepID=A0A0R3Q2Q8_ANGCS|nr:unnamed protein product [Angiostrongylus costaricensis]